MGVACRGGVGGSDTALGVFRLRDMKYSERRSHRMSDAEMLNWLLAQGIPSGTCLDWPRSRSRGYGYVGYKGRGYRVVRLVYTLIHGPIPDNLQILHSCDRPACFFPGHLRIGTRLDNAREAAARNLVAYGEKVASAKLSTEDVKDILELRAQGLTYEELAAQFNVDQSTIGKVIKRRTWVRVS